VGALGVKAEQGGAGEIEQCHAAPAIARALIGQNRATAIQFLTYVDSVQYGSSAFDYTRSCDPKGFVWVIHMKTFNWRSGRAIVRTAFLFVHNAIECCSTRRKKQA
jgi:hypothetical protein